MDDVLDLERAVLDLTTQRDALAAEVRRLRTRDEVAKSVVQAWAQTGSFGLPAALVSSLIALTRVHESNGEA